VSILVWMVRVLRRGRIEGGPGGQRRGHGDCEGKLRS
jgi:hypothetical protein